MKISMKHLCEMIRETIAERSDRDIDVSIYSDMYKERYGSRPRWMYDRLYSLSDEEMKAALDKLYAEPVDFDDNFEEENYVKYDDVDDIDDFEKTENTQDETEDDDWD